MAVIMIMMMVMMMKKMKMMFIVVIFQTLAVSSFFLLFSGTLHRFEEMEEKRHERELKFPLEMRREEREHELHVLQMMMQMRGCNSQWTTPGQPESEYSFDRQTYYPL